MSSPAQPQKQSLLVTIEKDVVLGAEKALAFVRRAEKATPAVAGALAVLLGGVDKALSDIDSAAQNPTQVINLQFDQQVFQDLKAVWPDVLAFAATLGIKKQ